MILIDLSIYFDYIISVVFCRDYTDIFNFSAGGFGLVCVYLSRQRITAQDRRFLIYGSSKDNHRVRILETGAGKNLPIRECGTASWGNDRPMSTHQPKSIFNLWENGDTGYGLAVACRFQFRIVPEYIKAQFKGGKMLKEDRSI